MARIADSTTVAERVDKVIQVANWLTEHDMPAVRLLPGLTHPIEVNGHLATLWELVPASGPAPTGTDLARLLRRWHALPAPDFGLPRWWPINAIRGRLAEHDGLDPDDYAFLTRRCGEIEAELHTVRFGLPTGPIWGDAFLGNVIPGPDGPVMCDFDGAAAGPREWDLTPIAVGALRLNYPTDDHTPLAEAYGFDVTTWDGFPILRQLRELQLVTSVLPVLRSNPSLHGQWRHRFHTLRTGDLTTRWSPYE